MSPKENGSHEKKSRGEVVPPHCSPHCSGISPFHCNEQTLPQVGEQLGFPSDLFETATQFSQERESLWPKRASCLDVHCCEVVVLIEGCVLLLFAPLN